MGETFSQQYCTLEPCGAGGYVVTGARMHNCLVKVADEKLTMIQAPSIRVARVPVSLVRIVTPDALRKIGTSVLLQLDGKLLNVDFGMVYRRQQRQQRGGPLQAGLKIVLLLPSVGQLRHARAHRTQADDLYELITEIVGKSLILTSNRASADWYLLLPNPVVAESLPDRLIDNSHQAFMNAPSYRPNEAPARVIPTGKTTAS